MENDGNRDIDETGNNSLSSIGISEEIGTDGLNNNGRERIGETGNGRGSARGTVRRKRTKTGSATDNSNGHNPPGTGKNQETAQAEIIDFTVEETPPITQERKKRKSKKNIAETKESVAVLLMLLDGFVSTYVHPQAGLTQTEHGFIDDPLARIIGRMSPGASDFLDKYTDPILLIFGLGMWFHRISKLVEKPKRQKQTITVPTENTQNFETEENYNNNGATNETLLQMFGGNLNNGF